MQPDSSSSNNVPFSAPSTSPNKKRWILVCVLAIAISACAGLAWRLVTNRSADVSSAASDQASVRIYYNDGKTLLWQSSPTDNSSLFEQKGFVGHVAAELVDTFGQRKLETGAWHITTTLDPKLQAAATEQMHSQSEAFSRHRVSDAALIGQDVTNGHIVSWAGTGDSPLTSAIPSTQQEVNTLALPLTYAAYIEETGATDATTLSDRQTPLPGYPCTNLSLPKDGGNCAFNFDYRYNGQITLRQALGGVRPVPAISAGVAAASKDANAGSNTYTATTPIWNYAKKQTDGKLSCYADESLQEETVCYTAATYGDGLWATPLTMLQAYATLAHNGKKMSRTGILTAKVDGKEVYSARNLASSQSMHVATAKTLTDILTDPAASVLANKSIFTTGSGAVGTMLGVDYDNAQASAIQYTTKYAVGIWMSADSQGFVGATSRLSVMPTHGWLTAATQ